MPNQDSKTHVALLVSPGMGHLIPFLELAKHLLHHNLQPTLFVVASGSSTAESDLLHKSSAVNIVPLRPTVTLHPNATFIDKIKAMMSASLPLLRSFISSPTIPRPATLIVDLFGTQALATARELDMLGFVFMTTSALFASLALHFPAMDRQMIDNHASKHEPLRIPGCSPIRFENTISMFEMNQEDDYQEFRLVTRELGTADGILLNTWQDIEPTTLKALLTGKVNDVSVHPIGTLTRRGEPDSESEVLKWLDRQPDESVIYVSFGSGGTLCEKQITELALGLELSQQRFVWVVRPPVETDCMGTFFTAGNRLGVKPPPEYLPEGFIERTKEVGLVVPMWGPQAEILSHRSVRGFLTHCGWNSAMESIVNGVAMVTWPLYAEQKINAMVLTEEAGVAIRVNTATDGVVGREEIERRVKKIMENEDEEGKGIRERELKSLRMVGKLLFLKVDRPMIRWLKWQPNVKLISSIDNLGGLPRWKNCCHRFLRIKLVIIILN